MAASRQRPSTEDFFTHSPLPFLILIGIFEDRSHAGAEDGLACSAFYPADELAESHRSHSRAAGEGGPMSWQQGAVLWQDHVRTQARISLVHRKSEIGDKFFSEGRDESQRASAEKKRRLDIEAVGQGDNGLDGNRMENRGGYIFTAVPRETRFWMSVLQKTPQREAMV